MADSEERIRAIEEQIRDLMRERMLIVDAEGAVVLESQGREDAVFIPEPMARGRIVIHNQPNGTSFSRTDVRVLLSTGAAEFRVITAQYRYRLLLPPVQQWSEIEGIVNQVYFDELEVLAAQVRTTMLTAEEAAREHLHRVWQRVAERLGWDYWREERDR